MKALKILVVVTALVAAAGLATEAWAACSPGLLFQSVGAPVPAFNTKISVVGANAAGNEIGRIWDSLDAANSNSGLTGPNYGSTCPVGDWWQAAGVNKKINGVQGAGTCGPAGCPSNDMTLVVEDYAEAGPPGIGDTAFYIGFRVEKTPALARKWDYGNVDGITENATVPMLEFPELVITGSGRTGTTVTVNYNNMPQSGNLHSWEASTSSVYPDNAIITEWQLLQATGSDPGRRRDAGWTQINETDYTPGITPDSWTVQCTNTVDDEYLAVGIGFNGGAAGIVDSALVGRAISIECNPNLADPDHGIEAKDNETIGKPGRVGGRR